MFRRGTISGPEWGHSLVTTHGSSTAPFPSYLEVGEPLLEVRDLKMHFPVTSGVVFRKTVGNVKAVDGVSFDVAAGQTLARTQPHQRGR